MFAVDCFNKNPVNNRQIKYSCQAKLPGKNTTKGLEPLTALNTVTSTSTITPDKTVMSKIFNLNNTLTIHTQPDADAIFGNWCRMLTLAVKDPEGYVRPHPNQPMNAKDFAQYFHRPLLSVEKTIMLLEEMNLISVRNGLIKVNACAADNTQTQKAESAPHRKDIYPQKSETMYSDLLSARTEKSAPLHNEPYPAPTKPGMIPLDMLPPASQRILTCWNKLPLIKMTGLYLPLETRLEELLQYFGEHNIINAIYIISHCPFLLNKADNSTGWFITFKWMLEEDHLERILQGDYLDRNDPMNEELQAMLQPR